MIKSRYIKTICYLLFFNYNNMRTWLTESEQKKINDVYGGYSPLYKHVHMCFSHTNSLDNISYEFDLVLTQRTTSYNDLHFVLLIIIELIQNYHIEVGHLNK